MAIAAESRMPRATTAPSTTIDLGKRKADAGGTDRPTERYHRHEGARHQIKCPAAELPGQHANDDHRKHMVQSGDRMQQAGPQAWCEIARGGTAGMSGDCLRSQQKKPDKPRNREFVNAHDRISIETKRID